MQLGPATPILRSFDEAKDYRHARPSVQLMPWGTRDMSVTDPFGNRLTFTNAISA